MDRIFGIISLGLGFYCFYAYYMLVFKGEINDLLMTPRNTVKKKCTDFSAFRKTVKNPLLILAIVVVAYGAIDLYNVQNQGAYNVIFLLALLASVIALIVYAGVVSKAYKKYFK